jgi:methionyl-tRNA synthetase
MSARRYYVTNAIPYVNGDPHLGHTLEFVQADLLARHRRLRGDAVRYGSGTDDHAIKNVEAAEAAGAPVRAYVDAKAERFAALRGPLELSYDHFIRTSADARHRAGVERLWHACAAAGDLDERSYTGRYCRGCEAFREPDELADGRCPEHGTEPELVTERNWFFRLSRHTDALLELLESGALAIAPEHRRNEVLAFVRRGLQDFSVSRPRERARGWGIPVPGDPGQVVYVWFDALANYVTALDYASDGEAYRTWWAGAGERVHVVGKGIIRFHAVYWPAILRSAGEPLPTRILVHDYLTVGGRKLSKSLGGGADPAALAARFGTDALRWWLVRDVPRAGDADFREDALARRADELADELGNLASRTLALAAQARPGGVPPAAAPVDAAALGEAAAAAPGRVDDALERFDLRAGADALWDVVTEGNRLVSATRPWELARAERAGDRAAGDRLDAVLGAVLGACDLLAHELAPFVPGGAARLAEALADRNPALARALFPKSPR